MTLRFVDTSVAVPLLLSNHQHHRSVTSHIGDVPLALTAHSAAETYSILTTRLATVESPPATPSP